MTIKSKSKVASLIYIIFAIVFVGGHIADISPLLCNFLVAFLGMIALGYCLIKKRLNLNLIIIGIMFTISMLFSSLYNANADYLDILWIWSYLGIAVLIYEWNISSKTYWVVAYSVIMLVLLYMIQGNAADELLKIGSENNISTYILFFVFLGYLSEKKENKAMKYIPAVLVLAISLWTASRAGVLSALVLICCISWYNLMIVKKGKLGSLFKLCFLVFFGIWAINHFFGDYMISFLEKMNQYGNTSIRTIIWLEYLKGMFDSFGNFLFGVNMFDGEYPLLQYYAGNPHNSFLMFHAKYGFVSLLIGCIFMFNSILKAKKNKNIMLIIVTLVASVRMFFDWIAFPGLYDVVFWLLMLYVIDKKNVLTKLEVHSEKK